VDEFTSRLAVRDDIPALTALMDAAIVKLQRAFLDDAQIASSRAIMGIEAEAEGFTRLELMSTLAGERLYTAYGFRPLERVADATGGAPVPLVRMEKPIDPRVR
jgi:hypothetical protein